MLYRNPGSSGALNSGQMPENPNFGCYAAVCQKGTGCRLGGIDIA